MKKFGVTAVMLAVAFAAFAQASIYNGAVFTDADRHKKVEAALPVIKALYKGYAAEKNYPAFAFGVVLDGQLMYAEGVGLANIGAKTEATPRSVFRIASMSKSITAVAILQLRDDGKLRLDEPAATYIPELKKVTYLTTDAPPLTVRNLLTHSAGFPEDNPWGDRQLADSDTDLLKLITNGVSFSTVPGVAYEYSNLGFALLGRIISAVSGKPYQQYITDAIFKPLGMTQTYWEFEKVPPAQLAHGYRWLAQTWREEALEHDGAYGAMGGVLTTIEDFAKYMQLHMDAWPPRSGAESPVLKRSSLREMHQPWTFGDLLPDFKFPDGRTCAVATAYAYGLGWLRDCAGRVMIGHSGGLPGFGSQWRFLPEYGIGVVSFANLTYAGTSAINLRVLDTLIKIAELKPRTLPPSHLLEQRKTELVNLLPHWNNAERSGVFAENFFDDYLIDSLKKEATQLFAAAGKITSISPVVPLNNLRGSFVLHGQQKDLEVIFTLTPENPALIQEYHLRERVKK